MFCGSVVLTCLGSLWFQRLRAATSADALEVVRGLVERVVLHPGADGQRGFDTELVGEIASMVRLGLSGDAAACRALSSGDRDYDLFGSSVKVVAGARNRRSHHSTVPI